MKKNQIKKKILTKYNCITKNTQLSFFKSFWKELMLKVVLKEYSKNDADYIYNLAFFEKLVKNLMLKGNKYKVRKFIFRAFKNYKYIVKLHPLFIYFYIIFYFLILIEFKSVQKAGKILRIPVNVSGEEIFLLRTLKLFSKTIKNKSLSSTNEDLQTKLFLELFNLTFFVKRSKFYSHTLSKYYTEAYDNMKYISYKWW